MQSKPTILSTKTLSISDQERLLQAGAQVLDYNAIRILPLPFEYSGTIENGIVSSKNGARLVLEKGINVVKWYCVGEKTKAFLEENRQKVAEMAENAGELAQKIIKTFSDRHFVFFCGESRRDELPQILENAQVSFKEIVTYRTELMPKTFGRKFEGILFFSPSGVRAYQLKNTLESPTFAFCIGATTASEAIKYTDKIIIASRPTVAHTVEAAAQHIRNTSTWN